MKEIYLSIPQPCHENWNEMTPNEQGRFCQNCQKTVIDFSSMSDGEVLNYFKQQQSGICGQFRREQLDRIYVPLSPSLMPQWMKAGLLASGLLTANTGSTQSLEQEKIVIESNIATQKIIIRGIVLDKMGEPLIGASVNIMDTKIGTVTDFDGYYELVIPVEFAKAQTWQIDFKYSGFLTKRMPVERLLYSDYQLDVVLAEGTSLSEVIVVEADSTKMKKICNANIVSSNSSNLNLKTPNEKILLRGLTSTTKIETIYWLRGKVMDAQRHPLKEITVKAGNHVVTTNYAGKYEFKLTESEFKNFPDIIFSDNQYRSKELKFDSDNVISVSVNKSNAVPEISMELAYISLLALSKDKTLGRYVSRWLHPVKNWFLSRKHITKTKSNRDKKDNYSIITLTEHLSKTEVITTSVYPNPFSSIVQINYQSQTVKNIQISIVDVNGKIVFQQGQKVESGENIINLTPVDLITGNYWLQIESSNEKMEVMAISKMAEN